MVKNTPISSNSLTKKCNSDWAIVLAIDDFGTGYSNPGSLPWANADRIKIGISFVRCILSSPSKLEIVRAIVQTGRSLGMKTIAEGVEHPAQESLLRELGCDVLQGYLLSPPGPAEHFSVLFTDHRARHRLEAIHPGCPIDDESSTGNMASPMGSSRTAAGVKNQSSR